MASNSLVAVGILEKDSFGDVLPIWSYPLLNQELESVLISRSGLEKESIPSSFNFSKFKSNWIYIFIQPNENQTTVIAHAICILATEYNPEKFLDLTQLFHKIYSNAEGSPVPLLQCWLSVFARGKYSSELGSFPSREYDAREALLATSIKDVIKLLGEEIILLWAAMIMKKRVVVFSDQLSTLLKLIRALPVLVWHRQQWDLLRPFVTISEPEINDLRNSGVYCAGFTDSIIREKEVLWDVLVDVNLRRVIVASHAKDDFRVTSIHKDFCQYLLASAEDEETSDQAIIKGLVTKTKDVLTKLETLKVSEESGKSYIDFETLQNAKLPPNMERFLFSVAAAEGMTKAQS